MMGLDLPLSVTPVDVTLALAFTLWVFLMYLAIRQRPY